MVRPNKRQRVETLLDYAKGSTPAATINFMKSKLKNVSNNRSDYKQVILNELYKKNTGNYSVLDFFADNEINENRQMIFNVLMDYIEDSYLYSEACEVYEVYKKSSNSFIMYGVPFEKFYVSYFLKNHPVFCKIVKLGMNVGNYSKIFLLIYCLSNYIALNKHSRFTMVKETMRNLYAISRIRKTNLFMSFFDHYVKYCSSATIINIVFDKSFEILWYIINYSNKNVKYNLTPAMKVLTTGDIVQLLTHRINFQERPGVRMSVDSEQAYNMITKFLQYRIFTKNYYFENCDNSQKKQEIAKCYLIVKEYLKYCKSTPNILYNHFLENHFRMGVLANDIIDKIKFDKYDNIGGQLFTAKIKPSLIELSNVEYTLKILAKYKESINFNLCRDYIKNAYGDAQVEASLSKRLGRCKNFNYKAKKRSLILKSISISGNKNKFLLATHLAKNWHTLTDVDRKLSKSNSNYHALTLGKSDKWFDRLSRDVIKSKMIYAVKDKEEINTYKYKILKSKNAGMRTGKAVSMGKVGVSEEQILADILRVAVVKGHSKTNITLKQATANIQKQLKKYKIWIGLVNFCYLADQVLYAKDFNFKTLNVVNERIINNKRVFTKLKLKVPKDILSLILEFATGADGGSSFYNHCLHGEVIEYVQNKIGNRYDQNIIYDLSLIIMASYGVKIIEETASENELLCYEKFKKGYIAFNLDSNANSNPNANAIITAIRSEVELFGIDRLGYGLARAALTGK